MFPQLSKNFHRYTLYLIKTDYPFLRLSFIEREKWIELNVKIDATYGYEGE